jgi:hypothetical protein
MPGQDSTNLYQYALSRPTVNVDPSGAKIADAIAKFNGAPLPFAIAINAEGVVQFAHFSIGLGSVPVFFPDTCEVAWFSIGVGLGRAITNKRLPTAQDVAPGGAGLGAMAGLGTSFEAAAMFRVRRGVPTIPPARTAGCRKFKGVFHTVQANVGVASVSGYIGEIDAQGDVWFGGTIGGGVGIGGGYAPWEYVRNGCVRIPDCVCYSLITALTFPRPTLPVELL